MSLSSVNFTRPRLNPTTSKAIVLDRAIFSDTANGRFIIDIFAQVNTNDRLLSRFILVPIYNGQLLQFRVYFINYQAQGASTYDKTSLATATAEPFTIPPLTQVELVETTSNIDLDALYTLAGDLRT
jgi:hypothetical protein